MLLAFESVSRSGSACMVTDAGEERAFRDLGGGECDALLVPMLDALIRECGVPTRLAVAVGPGSFTGLRVAVAAARTLSWIERLPVHAVDSLKALALQSGDGLWWVLMSLKKDTSFHGLFRVRANCCEVIAATAAASDDSQPPLHALTASAAAVGPALATKPDLAGRWCPGVRIGSPLALNARGVALAANLEPAVSWQGVLPAYHQDSAPVIQRSKIPGAIKDRDFFRNS
jgi:tRNA threonylcarbamoyl adenosine modification protein YeaZ